MKNRLECLVLIMVLALGQVAIGQPEILDIRTGSDTVGAFEKFELLLDVRAQFENPFDPDQVDISAVFTSPSGKEWTINGFYNYEQWRWLWMIRFSPDEPGVWRYVISVKDSNGQTAAEQKTLTVIPSGKKGPIAIAPNRRYLQYSDGSPFYGVGFWHNDGTTGRINGPELDVLKDLGVNFISTYITPLETWASGLGRYDQKLCDRLDVVFELLEDRDMLLSLNLWFHSYLSETVWGGGNVRWQTNPYQLVTSAKDFYRSEKAWEYQEKLYRYFIARWGYSRSLAIWFIVDEVNGTDGWASGDSLVAAEWGRKVHDYLKQNDPYQHLTTGTRSGGITQFWHEGYQVFDLANREIYEAQGFPIVKDGKIDPNGIHPLTHSYNNYAGEVNKLWAGYDKPAIIGETGWDHTFYEMSMPGYMAQYHNALWVTLASGSAMTPFWWSYNSRMNDNMVTAQLRNFRRFVDQINFSELDNPVRADLQITNGDAFGIRTGDIVFGWAANPKVDVAGETITVSGLPKGDYRLRLYHTWRGQFVEEREVKSSGKKVEFSVPVMLIERSHARYIGQDVAFILERIEP